MHCAGNISTLRDGPQAAGRDVAGLLRDLWDRHYTGGALTLALVAPQGLDEQEGWVRGSFAEVRPSRPAPCRHALTCL